MFKLVGSLFVFFFALFPVLMKSISSSEINFNTLKEKLIQKTFVFKLENYLRKIKMKNLGIINDANKDDFLFIDTNDKDKLILNNLSISNVNFNKMQDQKDFDEFKARVFTYIFKNKNLGKEEMYTPLGVNIDEEKFPGWKIYIVLMNSVSRGNKHKLLKVCFRENTPEDNFALIMNFDKTCNELITQIVEKEVMKEDNSESTKKLHYMQSKILEDKLKQKFVGKGINSNNKHNSFIEKSADSSTASDSPAKSFHMDTLANKFSVEELAKIKSLIKFAKTNQILEEVYSKKGDVKIEDLFNPKDNGTINLTSHSINSNQTVISSSSINIPSNTNTNTNTKSSFNETSDINVNSLQSEILGLRSIISNQNMKMENYFQSMNSNMNEMKEIIKILKHNIDESNVQKVKGENNKTNISSQEGSVNTNNINSPNKELKKLIKNNKGKKTAKTTKPLNTLDSAGKSSPFLSPLAIDSIEEDDFLETMGKVNKVDKLSKPKVSKEEKLANSGYDFINP